MITVSKEIEIDMGHRVPYHDAGCKHLHGHRWRIVVHITAHQLRRADERDPASGMVLDFGVIKKGLREVIHDCYDHKLVLWDQDPLLDDGQLYELLERCAGIGGGLVQVPVIPTSEGLARYWGEALVVWFATRLQGVWVQKVEVWETPTACAVWEVCSMSLTGGAG